MNPYSSRPNPSGRWVIARPLAEAEREPGREAALAQALAIHPVVARVLTARGFDTPEAARAFLNPRLSDLIDPFELEGMELAAQRVARALRDHERICVFGDYDADGLTATAVMLLTLRALGGDAFHYIPHRLREGYGLSSEALDLCAARGAKLIVTVDTGITALDEVAYARAKGMDVVVTDHHQSGDEEPDAVAVVNPNRAKAYYPHGRLSGVGVAFKLAHATLRVAGVEADRGRAILGDLLDLVALGTVADIVSLRGENRVLARWGLDRLGRTRRSGLRALLELAGWGEKAPTSYTVNFILAPRLNAAGRTSEPELGLQLLLEEDPRAAGELARTLNRLNDERRSLEKGILQDSMELLQRRGDPETDTVLVAEGEGWHEGVLGIVAARLADRFGRPVIVLALDRDFARGSARSFCGYDIHSALAACGGYLLSFGGHASAAGLRLMRKEVPGFRQAINEHARDSMKERMEAAALEVDVEVTAAEIDLALAEGLRSLEPFGQENPEPVLALRSARLANTPRIVGERHLRLDIEAGGRRFGVIGFNMADAADECEAAWENLDVAFVPRVDEWRGGNSVELEAKAMRAGG